MGSTPGLLQWGLQHHIGEQVWEWARSQWKVGCENKGQRRAENGTMFSGQIWWVTEDKDRRKTNWFRAYSHTLITVTRIGTGGYGAKDKSSSLHIIVSPFLTFTAPIIFSVHAHLVGDGKHGPRAKLYLLCLCPLTGPTFLFSLQPSVFNNQKCLCFYQRDANRAATGIKQI